MTLIEYIFNARLAANLFLATMALCGCSDAGARKGNFTTFFVEQVQTYGGRLQKTNSLPAIQARWTIKRDAKGFECVVADAPFAQLEAMAIEAFGSEGEGYGPPAATSPSRIFKASSVGIALIMRVTPQGVQFNCLRGTTNLNPFVGTTK
jgi:hypothetical protein